MLQDRTQKNGFAFAAMYFKGMNRALLKIKEKNEKLISLIDEELSE